MKHDHGWLGSYIELVKGKEVLELGCGSGIDTLVLSEYAETLVSGDRAPNAKCQGEVLALDHSKELPFDDNAFDTVVASLCLHYFRIKKTKEIIAEISRILKPQGSFICRLNSYEDKNYGAVGYPEIEPGFFNVEGEKKRFFQEQEIRSLWAKGYILNSMVHKSIDRYKKEKWIYEFSATRRQ